MKIISGTLKGRSILITKDNSYRPTTGRVKEAIFSVLTSGQFINPDTNESVLKGAITIDLFGGTGALTFEAISRGASKGVITENNPHNAQILEMNVKRFGMQQQIQIIKTNSTDLPTPPPSIAKKITIAFIDPPFNKNLISKPILELQNKGWLADSALLIIESHKKENCELTADCELIFSRKYGKAILNIYRYSPISNFN